MSMVNPLILIHAICAEIGLLAFLWVLVEMLNPSETRIARAQVAALTGFACLFFAWLVGGFYYVEVYGLHVKPLIKASDAEWVYSIVMEAKEHVFLFLPILASLTAALLYKYDGELIHNRDASVSIVLLAGVIFLIGFSIAGMGAIISSGYRFALMTGMV
jgi:hypothetical protein